MNSKRLNIEFDPEEESEDGYISGFVYKIREWWNMKFLRTWPLSVIMDWKYNIQNGVRNLIRWMPTIWKDRDWDGSYILTILIKKIELQRETIINNKIVHQDELKVMDGDMSKCLELLKKANDEWGNYEEPLVDQHDKKWGKREFDFVPIEDKNLFEMKLNYERDLTDEEKEQERKDFSEGLEKARRERERDLAEAMGIIARHVDEWWD
jgi:hypothetical protein